jgi:hypothetical protein
MKRTSLALLLALTALIPLAVEAVPVTLSLDNPNQSVAAPSSGFISLNFSGTLVIDPNYQASSASLNQPFNSSNSNFLTGSFDSAFLTFFGTVGTGTYTGNFFNITVPAGTPPDLYAFQQFTSNPSLFGVVVSFVGDGLLAGPAGTPEQSASQAFSILVTNGNQVPESGSSMAFLGLSVMGIFFARRAVVSSGKQAA